MRKNAQARFCSSKCRVYAHRAALRRPELPGEMTSRDRWVRWDLVPRRGKLDKVPFAVAGGKASSTNPRTWTSYTAAAASSIGVGLGYVLGDGIGCLDLDHCLVDGEPTEAAGAIVARYPGNYIEVSPSGDGLHIWGLRDELPGTKRMEDGVSVETYSTGRYITITGQVFQPGSLLPL